MSKLNKEERFVLVMTIFLILVITSLGILKKKFTEEEIYVSHLPDITDVSQEFTLKREIFTIEAGNEISLNPENYFKENQKLHLLTLDASNVNNKKCGKTEIKATYQEKTIVIPIEIVDTTSPVIQVKHNNYTWYYENGETPQDVMNYTGITVTDNCDIDLEVSPWIKEFPNKSETITYRIEVNDSNKNKSMIEVVITYVMPENEDVNAGV